MIKILLTLVFITFQTSYANKISKIEGLNNTQFEGVAFKILNESEVNWKVSNNHEFGGVKAFKTLFGKDKTYYRTRMLYFNDGEMIASDINFTWYSYKDRGKTYKLYYQHNPIIPVARKGDLLTVIKVDKDELIAIITKANSKSEAQILDFFNVKRKQIGSSGFLLNQKSKKVYKPKQEKTNTIIEKEINTQLSQLGKTKIEIDIYYLAKSDKYEISGVVSKVSDGDTFKIANDFLDVRLFGIDTPEKDQFCKRNKQIWSCGSDATKFLSNKILNKKVKCVGKQKTFGRLLYECKTEQGEDIAESIIREGYGIIYYSDQYKNAEKEARLNNAGLWNAQFIIPHDWRRGKRFID